MKKITFLKTLLVAVGLCVGSSIALAGDKTVVKYSFNDASSPTLTPASKVNFDYTGTSVVTSTKFLNIWSGENAATGDNNIPLSPNSEDISSQTWTLDYYWAAVGGGNKKTGYVKLMAGETTLFDIADPANGSTMTLNYGESSTATITVAGMNKSKRFSANTKDVYNVAKFWYHITIVGDPTNGVKMTMKSCADDPVTVVEDVELSATNVTPTSLIIKLGSITSHGIDDLSLTYYVEGEVVQNPVANYSAVDGVNRTVTATCETEGATIQHSSDGVTYEDGASITVSTTGNVFFKAVKGTSESDVVSFAVEAGETITLIAPTIVRSDNTTITITADQSKLLLSPTATIYYEYGAESGSFTGSKTLTVAADATITAYAEATGYSTSATSERAVALFPTNVETIENTPTKISGITTSALSTEIKTASEREYVALLLNDVQWGTNVYLQNLTLSDPIVWGIRNGNWYINTTSPQWILLPSMKAGDIVILDIDFAATDMVNATYAEKFTYGSRHAYIVTADGDVEFAVKKIDEKTMDYLYGIYAYRLVTDVTPSSNETGFLTFASDYALDFSATTTKAYVATAVADGKVQLTSVTKVPAGTGLILERANGSTEAIPVLSGDADDVSANKLVRGTGAAVDAGYVLVNRTGEAQFAGIGDTDKPVVAKNQAYLNIVAEAPYLQFVFAGAETTGISTVKAAAANGAIYNLNGQRVAKATKGLYIVNGKKAIIK